MTLAVSEVRRDLIFERSRSARANHRSPLRFLYPLKSTIRSENIILVEPARTDWNLYRSIYTPMETLLQSHPLPWLPNAATFLFLPRFPLLSPSLTANSAAARALTKTHFSRSNRGLFESLRSMGEYTPFHRVRDFSRKTFICSPTVRPFKSFRAAINFSVVSLNGSTYYVIAYA